MSSMETEINAREDAWGQGLVEADLDTMRDLVAEDALIFHGSGEVEDRPAFIANLFDRIEVQSLTRSDVRIRQLAPDVAVASCIQEIRIRPRAHRDAPFELAHANISKVWVQRGGSWLMASYHTTRLALRR